MNLRLRRITHNHHCERPTVFRFLANDVWRCPECGQRWRVIVVQPGAKMWLRINTLQYWTGR